MASYKPLPRSQHPCAAINCFSTREKSTGVSFFSFPKNLERCKKWVHVLKRAHIVPAVIYDRMTEKKRQSMTSTRNLRLCEYHFKAECFMNPMDKGAHLPNKRLRHDAVPSIFDLPALNRGTPSKPRKPPAKRCFPPAKPNTHNDKKARVHVNDDHEYCIKEMPPTDPVQTTDAPVHLHESNDEQIAFLEQEVERLKECLRNSDETIKNLKVKLSGWRVKFSRLQRRVNGATVTTRGRRKPICVTVGRTCVNNFFNNH